MVLCKRQVFAKTNEKNLIQRSLSPFFQQHNLCGDEMTTMPSKDQTMFERNVRDKKNEKKERKRDKRHHSSFGIDL